MNPCGPSTDQGGSAALPSISTEIAQREATRKIFIENIGLTAIRTWVDDWLKNLPSISPEGEFCLNMGTSVCNIPGNNSVIRLKGFEYPLAGKDSPPHLIALAVTGKDKTVHLNFSMGRLLDCVPEVFKGSDLDCYLTYFQKLVDTATEESVGAGELPDELDRGIGSLVTAFPEWLSASHIEKFTDAFEKGINFGSGLDIRAIPICIDSMIGAAMKFELPVSSSLNKLLIICFSRLSLDNVFLVSEPELCSFIVRNSHIISDEISKRAKKIAELRRNEKREISDLIAILACKGELAAAMEFKTSFECDSSQR